MNYLTIIKRVNELFGKCTIDTLYKYEQVLQIELEIELDNDCKDDPTVDDLHIIKELIALMNLARFLVMKTYKVAGSILEECEDYVFEVENRFERPINNWEIFKLRFNTDNDTQITAEDTMWQTNFN